MSRCADVNELALKESFARRVCCLWSTSRDELWIKGATSGDLLDLDEVFVNCEQNSLLFKVTPRRKGACHTKDASGATRVSCYYRRVMPALDGSLSLAHATVETCEAAVAGSSHSWQRTCAMALLATAAVATTSALFIRKQR